MVNKKIILPLIAALMVVAGVFAMSTKKEKTTSFVDYVWFPTDASGNIVTGIGGTQGTLSASNPNNCPEGSDVYCAKAFNASDCILSGGNYYLNVSHGAAVEEVMRAE